MDTDLLRTLVAITETGSFTEAAARVGRTQPAISQQVRRLEDMLGRPIFQRSAAAVMLTEHGQRFLPHAREILAAEEAALAEFRRQGLSGLVAVGLPEMYAESIIPRILPQFQARHPDVEVSLNMRESGALLRMLRDGSLDLAFITDSEADGLTGPVVQRHRVIWVAPRAQPVEHRRPLPVVLWREGTRYRAIIEGKLREVGRDYRAVVSTQSVGGMITAVASGLGVAAMIESNLNDRMRRLGPDADWPDLPELKVRLERAEGKASPLVRRLEAHVLQAMGVTQGSVGLGRSV